MGRAETDGSGEREQPWTIARAAEPGDWLDAAHAVVESSDLDVRARSVAVLKDRLPDLERDVVRRAIAAGALLSRIGEALGVSRQAIHKRYGPGAPEPSSPPTREMVERHLRWVAGQRERERDAAAWFERTFRR